MINLDRIQPFLGKHSIFPEQRHPFYIVAPEYTRVSAGIKALHYLCHALNSIGQPAFMYLSQAQYNSHSPYARNLTNPDWNTEILTQDTAEHHYKMGLTPIVIYPETIPGNPLGAKVVMRYVMNYPGHLGGDTEYHEDEILYGYSKKLAEAVGFPEQNLFIPVSDTSIYHPPKDIHAPRKGSCFWSAKYEQHHKGKLLPITRQSTKITRYEKNSQTPREIAELFRTSEVFYTYENTALAIEAMLCGCPAVFIPNEHLTEVIGLDELGWNGFAWGTEPEALERARQTIHLGQENYYALCDQFWHQLLNMVNHCHAVAEKTAYDTPMTLGSISSAAAPIPLTSAAIKYLKRYGILGFIKKIFEVFHKYGIKGTISKLLDFGRHPNHPRMIKRIYAFWKENGTAATKAKVLDVIKRDGVLRILYRAVKARLI